MVRCICTPFGDCCMATALYVRCKAESATSQEARDGACHTTAKQTNASGRRCAGSMGDKIVLSSPLSFIFFEVWRPSTRCADEARLHRGPAPMVRIGCTGGGRTDADAGMTLRAAWCARLSSVRVPVLCRAHTCAGVAGGTASGKTTVCRCVPISQIECRRASQVLT